MDKAPLYRDVIADQCEAQAFWLKTSDNVRIRAAFWLGGNKGTVYILTGRTEYIEKYASIAKFFYQKGHTVVVHDWRGQGLSDRLIPNHNIGHIDQFTDYQRDMDIVLHTSQTLELPQPFYQLSHSMGGCIGLRTLLQKKVFKSSVFTAPMWKLHGKYRMVTAHYISGLAVLLGLEKRLILGSDERNYLHLSSPERNSLTSDEDIFRLLKNQIDNHPELNVGGPSWGWLREALRECDYLLTQPHPDTPSLIILGSDEKLVDISAIQAYCYGWAMAEIAIIPNAKHEVLMESKVVRELALEKVYKFFES